MNLFTKIYDYIFDIVPAPIYRFYYKFVRPTTWYYRFKHIYQRIFWGFDDTETYSLDCSLYKWLLPRLKRYKELNVSWPDSKYKTFEDYQNELQKRIEQLEFINREYFECNGELESILKDFNEWLARDLNNLWW